MLGWGQPWFRLTARAHMRFAILTWPLTVRLLLSFCKAANPGTWEEYPLLHCCLSIGSPWCPHTSWFQPYPLPKGRNNWIVPCAWSNHREKHAWRAKSFCMQSAAYTTERKLYLSDRQHQENWTSKLSIFSELGGGTGDPLFLLQGFTETGFEKMLLRKQLPLGNQNQWWSLKAKLWQY